SKPWARRWASASPPGPKASRQIRRRAWPGSAEHPEKTGKIPTALHAQEKWVNLGKSVNLACPLRLPPKIVARTVQKHTRPPQPEAPTASDLHGGPALASERVERRLTAILAADVAGYSRLTGMDEEGTHLQLKEHLRVLVEPKVAEHRGRIVKNTGDGMLAEFVSVVDAM